MPDWLKEEMETALDEFEYRGKEVDRIGSTRPLNKEQFTAAYQAMCAASQEHKRLERKYHDRNGTTQELSSG